MNKNDDILEGVLAYFYRLAAIPHPSGHEEQISNYLREAFKELGCKVIQDEVYNIIADLPATMGKENAPLTILQGHMDMVCVADEGVAYNPVEDAIKVVRTKEYLQAEGTSLGADDGIGVAEILYIFATLKEHGPLRAIITVDEEVGMTGASFLAKKYFEDAKYLINCDSEDYDILTVGCAGSVNMDFSLPVVCQKMDKAVKGWRITVRGLKGGHSGERIGDGRANAIKILVNILAKLQADRAFKGLVTINGGVARNAIPSEAAMEFAFAGEAEVLQAILQEEKAIFQRVYSGVEDGLLLELQPLASAQHVMEKNVTAAIVKLVTVLHSGVFTMSSSLPGLVETSANIGTITTAKDFIRLTYFPRSSVADKLTDILKQGQILAEMTGFELISGKPSPSWKERTGSRLVEVMTEIFLTQNKREMTVNTIHAGLECGFHIEKNPDLDMVSIGVTTKDIHSPRERLVLSTVAPQINLMIETLKRIVKGI